MFALCWDSWPLLFDIKYLPETFCLSAGQLETVRSRASLRSSKLDEVRMLLLLSDFSTMSSSIPSSSGAEDTGDAGRGRMLVVEGR